MLILVDTSDHQVLMSLIDHMAKRSIKFTVAENVSLLCGCAKEGGGKEAKEPSKNCEEEEEEEDEEEPPIGEDFIPDEEEMMASQSMPSAMLMTPKMHEEIDISKLVNVKCEVQDSHAGSTESDMNSHDEEEQVNDDEGIRQPTETTDAPLQRDIVHFMESARKNPTLQNKDDRVLSKNVDGKLFEICQFCHVPIQSRYFDKKMFHAQTHMDIKRYRCDICDHQARTPSIITRHLKITHKCDPTGHCIDQLTPEEESTLREFTLQCFPMTAKPRRKPTRYNLKRKMTK